VSAAGLSGKNRVFLAELNRSLAGPFTPTDAAAAIGLDHSRTSRLLRQLASRGWLKRLQRGLYTTVPLEAGDAQAWSADPWTIAARLLAPGYIAGYTALHHWDLTDQIFSTTAFVTSRPVPHRQREIGSARFEIRHRPESALFGLRRVWRDGVPVQISDREKTVVDCLDDPSLGGGLRHVAEALKAYGENEAVAWQRLIEYGDRLGNKTVFKRLGYLAETLGFADGGLSSVLLDRISAGIGKLDPNMPGTGSISSRWGLRINSEVPR
jgi:predicted transcriptional regulator of viral defense system